MKFEELSPELQEKVAACKTAEDIFALAKSEGIELSEEDLELISDGAIFSEEKWGKGGNDPEGRGGSIGRGGAIARGKC